MSQDPSERDIQCQAVIMMAVTWEECTKPPPTRSRHEHQPDVTHVGVGSAIPAPMKVRFSSKDDFRSAK